MLPYRRTRRSAMFRQQLAAFFIDNQQQLTNSYLIKILSLEDQVAKLTDAADNKKDLQDKFKQPITMQISSVFLNKLNILKNSEGFDKSGVNIRNHFSMYLNQYLNADDEQKKLMDKNSNYILNKIKTLEGNY